MRNPFVYGVGGVVSADIAVPEHQRELEFYADVLTTGDSSFWQRDLHNNAGTPIIGLGERSPEYESLPLQWMPHFQVADVRASVDVALELGGNLLMQSEPGDSQSQWAGVTDPDGAAFGLIAAVTGNPDDGLPVERLGRIAWLSLNASDAKLSQNFYQQVVGWQSNLMTEIDGDQHSPRFEMQIDGNHAAAEINQVEGDGSDVPSVWLIHLPVNDLDESLQKVSDHGGEIIQRLESKNTAVVRDPVGVYLALQEG